METPMKLIVDSVTGEQQYLPLTEEEIAEREQIAIQVAAEDAAIAAEKEAIAALRASAIAKLTSGTPLTPEEAALITA